MEDMELKTRLLNKYSGYLSSLWKELSRKKKKGKLPRDARQKLLHWWQLHYMWPYPSVRTQSNSHVDLARSCTPWQQQLGVLCMPVCEQLAREHRVATELFTDGAAPHGRMQELEKAALAESTGLDAKQINNWFINQRKRHWKPAPPAMVLATDYRRRPYGGGASSSSGSAALRMEGQHFAGGSSYPRGP